LGGPSGTNVGEGGGDGLIGVLFVVFFGVVGLFVLFYGGTGVVLFYITAPELFSTKLSLLT
jgi:hypothetical protein